MRFGSPVLLLGTPLFASGAIALVRETSIAREIVFARNQAGLSSEAKSVLDEAAGLLTPNPSAGVRIIGFAAPAAGDSGGETLARRRAEAAAAYLSSRGIVWPRMVVGYGTDAAPNFCSDARRVVVTVILSEEIPPP